MTADNIVIVLVFVLTYLGMAAGRLPWLQVDRTGIALLGVIVLLGSDAVTLDDLGADIDMPTLVLLFALMIISAQLAASGFYDWCARFVTRSEYTPAMMLALTVAAGGALAALFANDILLFALVPLVIAGVRGRGLDPRPFLIALAGAANAGSAATLIGAPQNILVGEIGSLSFAEFLLVGGVPAVVSLAVVFATVWFVWRDRMSATVLAATREVPDVVFHPHDRNQTLKGAVALLALLLLFATDVPRATGALVIAAVLLANRKFTSRTMIAAVDWPLLLLFTCLFGITGSLAKAGLVWPLVDWLQGAGLMPDSLAVLTPLTLVMSNTIGNVPSTILLVQIWPSPPQGALYGLALLSTLSGNLLLVGSISNIILAERAAAFGVEIGFAEYARVSVPATLLSIAFAVCWLAWGGWLPLLPG
ncbi:MAG: anion transporter [Rhodospirillales bacterium]|nr:anion transporter [Rhodospirillales bacterium]